MQKSLKVFALLVTSASLHGMGYLPQKIHMATDMQNDVIEKYLTNFGAMDNNLKTSIINNAPLVDNSFAMDRVYPPHLIKAYFSETNDNNIAQELIKNKIFPDHICNNYPSYSRFESTVTQIGMGAKDKQLTCLDTIKKQQFAKVAAGYLLRLDLLRQIQYYKKS